MSRTDPALARHIDDLWPDLEHLLVAGDEAFQLRLTPGWNVLMELLQAEIDAINAQMETGKALEQAQYAVRHGRIGGLRAVQSALDAIVETAERRQAEQQAKHEATAEPVAEGV